MKRRWLIGPFLFCSLLLSAQSKLTVTVSELPPLTSEAMPSKGLLAEILLAAFEGTPYSLDFRFFPLARTVAMRNKGEATVTIGNEVLYGKEIYWFVPICRGRAVFFYKKANYPSGINDARLSELTHFRIGVLNRSPLIDDLKKAGITNIDLSNSHESNIKKLALNRVDLVLMVDLYGIHTLKDIGADIREYGMTEGYVLPVIGLLVLKSLPNSEDIAKTFLAGYSKIKANGKLKTILERYFGEGQIPGYFIQ